MLMSGYAQYFLSLLRILRLNFCQEDVLRLMKTGFTGLTEAQVLEMENYALAHGIHRNRWLKPFHIPDQEDRKEAVQELEACRKTLTEPIIELRRQLSGRDCTGKRAAALLFDFVTEAGIYDRLLAREEELAVQGLTREQLDEFFAVCEIMEHNLIGKEGDHACAEDHCVPDQGV